MAQDPSVVLLKNVRLSYPNLSVPKAHPSSPDNKRYSAAFLIDKKDGAETIKAIKAAIKNAILSVEQWKNKTIVCEGIELHKGGPEKIKLAGICLHDGSEKSDKDGYGDHMMYVSAARPEKGRNGALMEPPKLCDEKANQLPRETTKIYGGCHVHATIRVWAQNSNERKGINADLRAVMFARDGEPFGNGPVNPEQEFGEVMEPESYDSPVAAGKAAAGDDWG